MFKRVGPPLIKRVANFATTIVRHVISGTNVSDEIFNERISICEKCPLFNSVNRICESCGCYMDVKAKFGEVKCPDTPSRWNATLPEKACKTCN